MMRAAWPPFLNPESIFWASVSSLYCHLFPVVAYLGSSPLPLHFAPLSAWKDPGLELESMGPVEGQKQLY